MTAPQINCITLYAGRVTLLRSACRKTQSMHIRKFLPRFFQKAGGGDWGRAAPDTSFSPFGGEFIKQSGGLFYEEGHFGRKCPFPVACIMLHRRYTATLKLQTSLKAVPHKGSAKDAPSDFSADCTKRVQEY